MAATVKETSVLRVVLNDEAGGEKNINLDDYVSDVTLQSVKDAFDAFFNKPAVLGGGADPLLQTSTGFKLTSVARAETVETVVRTTYLA